MIYTLFKIAGDIVIIGVNIAMVLWGNNIYKNETSYFKYAFLTFILGVIVFFFGLGLMVWIP